jgi:metal-sulfur cluster biosynthetic enzyme
MSDENLNIIKWTIHDTHPDLVEPARNSLAQVVDPEIGMNIIQLGLVRDITIEGTNGNVARLKMILTTPFCPYGPAMVDMTRQKAQEGLKMPVTVEMGMEVWDFSMMEDPSALDWGLYA